MTDDLFWSSNRFHWCALAAGFLAASEGRLDDSLYVRELAYHFFESGAFKGRVKTVESPSLQTDAPAVRKTLTMPTKRARVEA
jgi:hypothetical protein